MAWARLPSTEDHETRYWGEWQGGEIPEAPTRVVVCRRRAVVPLPPDVRVVEHLQTLQPHALGTTLVQSGGLLDPALACLLALEQRLYVRPHRHVHVELLHPQPGVVVQPAGMPSELAFGHLPPY